MIINGIQTMQIQQSNPRPRDNNAPSAAKPTIAAPSTSSRAIEGQLQGVLNNIDSMKQQLDAITVYDPPFFPIGVPLRADWINKLNSAQDETAQVASKTGNKGLSFTPQNLKDNATDAEVVGAIQNLSQFSKDAAQIIPPATDKKEPGAFVSIKV